MSEAVAIALTNQKPQRGKFPVTLMQGDTVLLTGQVNPHKSEEIECFVEEACQKMPALEADGLRAQLLQLAAPPPAGANEEDDGVPYHETDAGLVWSKPTKEGAIDVPLTNFTARIATDVVRDDGAERQHVYEIEAALGGREHRFNIPAAQFAGMSWPTEYMGPGAIVYAGMGTRDHARVAVQTLSTGHASRTIFTHTGWRHVDGEWVYLHAGGAIGADGAVEGIEVDVPDALSNYTLPDPPDGDELADCILASLEVLFVAPFLITMPLLCAVYRAVLGVCDTSVYVAGPSGAKKSELAALASQHFGAGLDRLHLPANWASTDNSLEGLAFAAKDALLVIDDFAPAGTQYDVQRLHQKADRVLRAQGNHAGRQRMRADGSLRSPRSPRGMILSTGEDIPRGVSLRARLFAVEVGPADVDLEKLTACQAAARDGRYAKCVAAYVRWLASRIEQVRSALPSRIANRRNRAAGSTLHARTPEAVANLFVGFSLFLDFAVDAGAIRDEERRVYREGCWHYLGRVAQKQAALQRAAEPVQRFLELLASALTTGNAHLGLPDGRHPPDQAAAWGWRQRPTGSGDSACYEWQPQGQRIGWVTEEFIYLDPDASYKAAQNMGGSGEGLAITPQTLRKRLHERGLLIREAGRDELTVRRVLEGVQRHVLNLRRCSLLDAAPAAISATPGIAPDLPGPAAGGNGGFGGSSNGNGTGTGAVNANGNARPQSARRPRTPPPPYPL